MQQQECGSGNTKRKELQVTAGPSFTHVIRHERQQGHHLVTHGIYHVVRHPGYLGWFVWSVGTQILLCNPFCAVGFAFVVRCRKLACIPSLSDLVTCPQPWFEHFRAPLMISGNILAGFSQHAGDGCSAIPVEMDVLACNGTGINLQGTCLSSQPHNVHRCVQSRRTLE
jgi:hypothetical protein